MANGWLYWQIAVLAGGLLTKLFHYLATFLFHRRLPEVNIAEVSFSQLAHQHLITHITNVELCKTCSVESFGAFMRFGLIDSLLKQRIYL